MSYWLRDLDNFHKLTSFTVHFCATLLFIPLLEWPHHLLDEADSSATVTSAVTLRLSADAQAFLYSLISKLIISIERQYSP